MKMSGPNIDLQPRRALLYEVTANRFIHRKVLLRLLIGWLLLGIVIVAVIFKFEIGRIENDVHQLALEEAAIFSKEFHADFDQIDDLTQKQLTNQATQLINQHFLVVEIYGLDKKLKLEVAKQENEFIESSIDRYRHKLPQEDGFSHELHFINGQLLLVTLVPLKNDKLGVVRGYFEGVYQLDSETYQKVKQDLSRTLGFVTLGITFTCLLMYPIILTLNSGIIKLSSQLLQGNLELLNVLGCAIAERDEETNSHNYRVTYYALMLGKEIGLTTDKIHDLMAGAFLHDVGKIGIRDLILLKEGKLTPDEFEIMKTHVSLGVEILNKSPWLMGARDVVEFHHEKYDGSGYLQGIKANEIPLNARIFAIVDVFDALTSKRPYKKPWLIDDALAMLEKGSGNHFDPHLVETFLYIAPELYQDILLLDSLELEKKLLQIMGEYFL